MKNLFKSSKKVIIIATLVILLMMFIQTIFAAVDTDLTPTGVSQTTLDFLKKVRLYSWPICFVLLVLGFINYYILGSQKLEKKLMGKRIIIGAICYIAIAHLLPLIYIFVVGQ